MPGPTIATAPVALAAAAVAASSVAAAALALAAAALAAAPLATAAQQRQIIRRSCKVCRRRKCGMLLLLAAAPLSLAVLSILAPTTIPFYHQLYDSSNCMS